MTISGPNHSCHAQEEIMAMASHPLSLGRDCALHRTPKHLFHLENVIWSNTLFTKLLKCGAYISPKEIYVS